MVPAASPRIIQLKNGQSCRLRPVTPGDAPAVVDHVNRLGQEGDNLVIEGSAHTPLEEDLFIRTLDPNLYLYELADFDGVLGGLLFVSRGGIPKIRHLATLSLSVAPEYRRLGVGRSLLAAAVAWAQLQGVEKLFLSVISSNIEAIALYKATGFFIEGSRPRHFKVADGYADEVLMARFFDPGNP